MRLRVGGHNRDLMPVSVPESPYDVQPVRLQHTEKVRTWTT